MLRKTLFITLCMGMSIMIACSNGNNETIPNGNDPGYTVNQSGTINGHEYVDLGLPSGLKWATCNVGATAPTEYGEYFAWGETTPKSEYTAENSSTYGTDIPNISGKPKYDAATANWGGTWRMPTKEEMQELKDKCTWEWTTQNGVKGALFTGPNGNQVFFPAAGYRFGPSLYSVDSHGYYWSSSPYDSQRSYGLGFNNSGRYENNTYRYGQSIRPVSY